MLFDSSRADYRILLQEKMATRDAVISLLAQASCTTLGPYTRSLEEKYCVGLSKFVVCAFWLGFLDTQFKADTTIVGVALPLTVLEYSKQGVGSTKDENLVDSAGDINVFDF